MSQRSLDNRIAVRGFNIYGASRRKIHDRWTALCLSNLRVQATLAHPNLRLLNVSMNQPPEQTISATCCALLYPF
jgi:hypothetical protein